MSCTAPADRAAFEEAGIPQLAYFDDPAENMTLQIKSDPADGTVESIEFTDVDAHLVNLCKYFHGDGDDGHDHR
jgi:hypothetical protein